MKNKAIFLDRDGTINVNTHYVNHPNQVEILPNVIPALKILKKLGYLLIIITNQSGIARGYFKESDLKKVNNRLFKLLKKEDIRIDDLFYCPYHKQALLPQFKKDSFCRKPKPGMIYEATKKHNIDISQSYMIGDMPSDIGAGINAKCRASILVHNTVVEQKNIQPTYKAKNLLDAAVWISRDAQKQKILSLKEIQTLSNELHRKRKKIVLTNGVFDLIHPGHINFLSLSKKLGDILIVGVNSDASVKKNKGPTRPINSEQQRVELLASLDFVDYIVVFNHKTPVKLVEAVKPHFHIKDDTYSVEKIVEYKAVVQNGGQVIRFPRIAEFSSSNIIKKM